MSETPIQPKDVVFLSMSTFREWQDGIVNRSRHVLHELQRQGAVGRILCVDFPPRTMKGVARRFFRDRNIGGRRVAGGLGWTLKVVNNDQIECGVEEVVGGKMGEVVVLTVHWMFKERQLRTIVRRCVEQLGFSGPILWSYNPLLSSFFAEDLFSKKVFDAVDDWRRHPAYLKDEMRLNAAYNAIGQDADVIFTVSKKLTGIFPSGKTHWVHNGVDVAYFQKPQAEPEELRRIPHPRIGYVGVIQSRLDFSLVRRVAQALPDYHFVFCGWVWDEVKPDVAALSALPNVHFLGRKEYAVLPAYVQHFDVGIIPHKVDALTESMDPLKLYEYLACCKPVVATSVPLSVQNDFVMRAHDASSFGASLQRAVVTARAYTCDAKNLAREHGWTSRVAGMLDLLK